MVRVIGIDHVQLAMPVGEEERARAFYVGLLGIPEVPKPPEMARRGGCWFETAGLKVHVGVEPDFRPAKKAHPALLVDNLAAMEARLAAAGYQTIPNTELEEVARCFLADPFGNRIELIQS
jgi:catechol 2,3-dioxygenase-like lactoylglutathione lyase family enzyme